MLDVFQTVDAEWDEGTARPQQETEQGSHNEGKRAILVGHICGDHMVPSGTCDLNWELPKWYLHDIIRMKYSHF